MSLLIEQLVRRYFNVEGDYRINGKRQLINQEQEEIACFILTHQLIALILRYEDSWSVILTIIKFEPILTKYHNMRKITVCILTLVFLAVGAVSCAKSNKNKVTNEWKVVSYEKTDDYTGSQGSTNSTKMSMNESSFTLRNVAMTNGVVDMDHTSGGSVNSHELSVKKDGTWSWIQDITYVYDNGSSRKLVKETGTWSFVRKTKGDDFKKNERILFNVSTENVFTNQISGQVVVSENSTNKTFLTGENIRIYTITESKRKELQLELDSKVVAEVDSGGENTDNERVKITLKEK